MYKNSLVDLIDYNLVMKKIIYIFILLLPIILLSCSGSNIEAELKSQLEIAEQKNQQLINKAEAKEKAEAEAKLQEENQEQKYEQ